MNIEQAQAIAKAVWGAKGFARECRRFIGNEQPGPDGWVRAAGDIYAWEVGYYRKGKRGGRLSTVKGTSGADFYCAFCHAMVQTRGQAVHDKLLMALRPFVEGNINAA